MELQGGSQVQASRDELQLVPRGHGQLIQSPGAQAPVGQGPLNSDHDFDQYQSPPPHHPHPPSQYLNPVQAYSHRQCRKVYLYTRRPHSIRSVARQAYNDYVRHRGVDSDLQKWALLVGDDYYEAVREGSQLQILQYDYRERRTHGWDRGHRKFLLGCTALDDRQIAERVYYVRQTLENEASTSGQEFVRRLFDVMRPEVHWSREIPHIPWASVRSIAEFIEVLMP